MANQESLPIVEQLQKLAKQPQAAFYTPGHKRGQEIHPILEKWWGKAIFQADLPELPEFDNLFAPEGVIQEAQALAAEVFGGEHSYFLVNGSTGGIIAAILAVCGPGDKIILPRNVHQSVITGLILSGAMPVFLSPEYDIERDIPYSITPEAVSKALTAHPDTKAVFMVYPTYQGVCGDLKGIVTIAHAFNIPVLVDEAHGAHLGFHPALPASALSLGADLTVQSTHKTLGAFSQASMLHRQGSRIDPQRLRSALQLVQSTSPNSLLLASLDAVRQRMALQGEGLMSQTLQLANMAREKLAGIPGISLLSDGCAPCAGFECLDLTRLTVFVHELPLNGFEIDEILGEQWEVMAELPLFNSMTFIVSVGNLASDITQLVQGWQGVVQQYPPGLSVRRGVSFEGVSMKDANIEGASIEGASIAPLREAYFAPKEMASLSQAVGRVSGGVICPYPPGIPVLMPGEKITVEAIAFLQQVLAKGGQVTGLRDSSLQTLEVVK